MPDMLVKLYELPDAGPLLAKLEEAGIEIRRALAPEKRIVIDWVRSKFSQGWADECEVSFTRVPLSCYIAVENNNILGFACYEVTQKNFFGPTGVDESCRGKGVGKALLLACLQAMKAEGYGYAIIGGAGPTDFYAAAVGAVEISGSVPGVYRNLLK